MLARLVHRAENAHIRSFCRKLWYIENFMASVENLHYNNRRKILNSYELKTAFGMDDDMFEKEEDEVAVFSLEVFRV